jgi:hypothetical protein
MTAVSVDLAIDGFNGGGSVVLWFAGQFGGHVATARPNGEGSEHG